MDEYIDEYADEDAPKKSLAELIADLRKEIKALRDFADIREEENPVAAVEYRKTAKYLEELISEWRE